MAVSDYVLFDIAQPIHEGYFDKKLYPHIVTTKLKVEIYKYTPYMVDFIRDVSNQVVDYSYDCDCNANPRQSASITLHVEKDDQIWYMRRENKMYEWYDGNAEHAITWQPLLYKLTKIYKYDEKTRKKPAEINLGFFIPTDNTYNYDSTTGTIQINLSGMSALFTKEYGGGVTTLRIGKEYRDPETHEMVNYVLPTTLGIDEGTAIDDALFFRLAMGSNTNKPPNLRIESMPVPITRAWVEGQELWDIPYDLEFDADISVQDMFDQVLELGWRGQTPSLWVDENRVLRVNTKPITRGGSLVMNWKDYQDLVMSENISYNDSDWYNITEVYGKDNAVYAVCEAVKYDMGLFPRKQVITDSDLQTVEECQKRADWENYKSRYGRMSINATLVDGYIPQLNNPSTVVGRLIEYTTIDGDTNLYFLNKLSNSAENWTMELSLFKPLYNTKDIQYKQTLATPYISGHEVINDNGEWFIRLYVKGADIGLGVTKIYTYNDYNFVGESVETDGTYDLPWKDDNAYKYIDIPIAQNKIYRFVAALYSPFYEDSGLSEYYTANVTEITVPAVTIDPDPYPHPYPFVPSGEHRPYVLTAKGEFIKTDNNENITI